MCGNSIQQQRLRNVPVSFGSSGSSQIFKTFLPFFVVGFPPAPLVITSILQSVTGIGFKIPPSKISPGCFFRFLRVSKVSEMGKKKNLTISKDKSQKITKCVSDEAGDELQLRYFLVALKLSTTHINSFCIHHCLRCMPEDNSLLLGPHKYLHCTTHFSWGPMTYRLPALWLPNGRKFLPRFVFKQWGPRGGGQISRKASQCLKTLIKKR